MYNLNKLNESIENLSKFKNFIHMNDLFKQNINLNDAVILRFDVERNLAHHLKIAQYLHNINVKCTMYFHTRKETFDPAIIKEIQSLGHEIGYHHECLDRCQGNFEEAKALFIKEVNLFKAIDIDLMTVCSHGELGLPKKGYKANYELFNFFPHLLEECGLKGEVYLNINKNWVPNYVSDTFKGYAQFFNQIEKFKNEPKLLQILVHPHRWNKNFISVMFQVLQDFMQALQNKIIKKRSYNLFTLK
jgi:hypothetical protein